MQTNYEQINEAARGLSPEEIEKLGEWARRQQSVRRKSVEKNAEVEEEVRKFNLAMKWIREHREKFSYLRTRTYRFGFRHRTICNRLFYCRRKHQTKCFRKIGIFEQCSTRFG